MYGDNESEEGLAGTYEIYKAEADALFKNGDYRKAIESYSTALQLRPEDRVSLVCRSKCQLMLGDTSKALQDAEAALAEDGGYHKGMFQKAEALYQRGDFELALVFYHRGHRLRPELQEFRLGIQKAQEAIENCVGSPDVVKLNTSGDLSFFDRLDDKKTGRRRAGVMVQRPTTAPRKRRTGPTSPQTEKTIRQMLGELYGDRMYLEKLLKETGSGTSKTGQKISSLAEAGLSYLDTRTEFWQQVKPMYARKYETQQAMSRYKQPRTSPHQYVLGELEKVDALMAEANYEGALKKAQRLTAVLDGYSEQQLPDKLSFKANVHSLQGNAYLELEDFASATKHHQADLGLGEDYGLQDAESRGLDNLGRVYARMGKFDKAIQVWERKLPLSKTPIETTWLCHELGRCYLEVEQAATARDLGERSLAAAREAGDDMWQLHALVLISQAEVKDGRLSEGLDSFQRAQDMAEALGDAKAQQAIKKAIEDVNAKLAAQEKQGGGGVIKEEEEEPKEEPKPEVKEEPKKDKKAAKEPPKKEEKKEEVKEETPPESTQPDADMSTTQQPSGDDSAATANTTAADQTTADASTADATTADDSTKITTTPGMTTGDTTGDNGDTSVV